MNTKQVIVLRKDLNMRKGKMCAQASHASMSFLTKAAVLGDVDGYTTFLNNDYFAPEWDQIEHWLKNSFRKIVCYVESETELIVLHELAERKGLISHLITDNGATEFGGVPTKTCLAIGPHWDEKFIGITDHLPLL